MILANAISRYKEKKKRKEEVQRDHTEIPNLKKKNCVNANIWIKQVTPAEEYVQEILLTA